MNEISCCYKCSDRVVGCHSKCERYIAYRKDIDEYNDKVRNELSGEMAYTAYRNALYHKLTNKKQYNGCTFRSRVW